MIRIINHTRRLLHLAFRAGDKSGQVVSLKCPPLESNHAVDAEGVKALAAAIKSDKSPIGVWCGMGHISFADHPTGGPVPKPLASAYSAAVKRHEKLKQGAQAQVPIPQASDDSDSGLGGVDLSSAVAEATGGN